jgi:hypothetical protein
MHSTPTPVETRVEPYFSRDCFIHRAGLLLQAGWRMAAFELARHWDNSVLLVTYQRAVSHGTMLEEMDRLRLLERIIGEASTPNHRYHFEDVLARFQAALLPHTADVDTAILLAQGDLRSWERRHEYFVPDAIEDLCEEDLRSMFLRVEGGWRVYPVAEAHADDLRSHVRQQVTRRIAALEVAIDKIGRSISDAAAYDLDTLVAEGETLRARWLKELASAQRLLLEPPWRAEEPSAPAKVLAQQLA